MANSSIGWTNKVWNPLAGCTRVSPGCDNCYAARMTRRLEAMGREEYAGLTTEKHFNGKVRLLESRLDDPLHWKKPCMIFVNSMSDLFHKEVPGEFIAHVFETMRRASWHTFQVLTKRPKRMAEIQLPWSANVWAGVSIETQVYADRIDWLTHSGALTKFLSCEPLLGPLELDLTRVDWVIVGGESGPNARRMEMGWLRSIVSQCREAQVPVFVKQDSGRYPGTQGRIPDDLWRYKQFPKQLENSNLTIVR